MSSAISVADAIVLWCLAKMAGVYSLQSVFARDSFLNFCRRWWSLGHLIRVGAVRFTDLFAILRPRGGSEEGFSKSTSILFTSQTKICCETLILSDDEAWKIP